MIAEAASHKNMTLTYMSRLTDFVVCYCFSSPGQSPGRAIVLTPASALASEAMPKLVGWLCGV